MSASTSLSVERGSRLASTKNSPSWARILENGYDNDQERAISIFKSYLGELHRPYAKQSQ
jgi:hypothetical protein